MEDVSYMLENGETETHVIFVDSSQRDIEAYPLPSEYTIPFDEPLRNVVGVDVLDSVIPSTLYIVDDHNHDVRSFLIATTAEQRHTLFVPELSNYLRWWLQLETEPEFDPYSTVKDNSITNGILEILDDRIPNLANGFLSPPDDFPNPLEDSPTATTNQRRLGVRSMSNFLTRTASTDVEVVHNGVTYFVPAYVGWGTTRSMIDSDGTGNVVLLTLAYGNASDQRSLRISRRRHLFPKGNFATLKLLVAAAQTGDGGATAMTDNGLPTGAPFITSVSTEEDRLLQIQMDVDVLRNAAGGTNCVFAYDLDSGMSEVLGFSGSHQLPSVLTLARRAGKKLKKFATNQTNGGNPVSQLVPGGLANLTGERYIILRCIEVEAGMFAQSSTGSRGTGIGLFKLPVPGTLREQRQDYITVVKRPFHPIGRMDGLSLRLERGRSPGELYNFKGVNHLIVIAVKVLVPKRQRGFERSALNPNYDKDFLRYSLTHRLRDTGSSRPMTAQEMEIAMRRHEYLTARLPEAEAKAPGEEFEDYESESETDSDVPDRRYAAA